MARGNPNWRKDETGKGTSGNPGGRPKKLHDVTALAQKRTLLCIQRLTELSRSVDGAVAVAACKALLERGWGKPEASIKVNVTRTTRNLSTEELSARIAELEAAEARH